MSRDQEPAVRITNAFKLALTAAYWPRVWIMRVNVAPVKMGAYFIHSAPKGTSDLIGTVEGRAVGFEIKAGKDQQSEWQKEFQAAWERAGGIYIIVREDIEAALRELAAKLT